MTIDETIRISKEVYNHGVEVCSTFEGYSVLDYLTSVLPYVYLSGSHPDLSIGNCYEIVESLRKDFFSLF